MFDFTTAPVPVRNDLKQLYRRVWMHFAGPGPCFNGFRRGELLAVARGDRTPHDSLEALARTLYADPASVDERMVRTAANDHDEPATVEAISLTSILSAVDGTHVGLGVNLEPLPEPATGDPSGGVADGLKRRRTHVPMRRGAIPVALDLLPTEAAMFRSMFGPQYMTDDEMQFPGFRRAPGLNRAQMELISSRTSMINRCFY